MKTLAIGFALALAALLPSNADAAMWVHMTLEPARPQVDEPARLSVLTYYLTELRCDADPLAERIPHSDWHPPLSSVVAEVAGPEGQTTRIALERNSKDPSYWDADLRFKSVGNWTIRVVEPGFSQNNAEDCAGARLQVEVGLLSGLGPSKATPVESSPVLALGISSVLALSLAVLLGRRRRTA
jgi:hypothetical protein